MADPSYQTPYAPCGGARDDQHRAVWLNRASGALVALACGALLAVGAGLRPDLSGIGTHEQMGLPPCGFFVATGWPCVTCGVTTAFAEAVHGRLLGALRVQPMGAALAVAVAVGLAAGLWGAATGRPWWGPFAELCRPGVGWVFFAMVMLSWGYKVVSVRLGWG